MKKSIIRFTILAVIFVLCLSGCNTGANKYLTTWTFRNDSDQSVYVKAIFQGDSSSKDTSWSPCEFTLSPGKSNSMNHKEVRNEIYFGYSNTVKVDKSKADKFLIIFENL